jgi:hypothetical protein
MIMQMMPTMSCGHGWARPEEDEAGREIVSVAIAVPPKPNEAEVSSTSCHELQRFALRDASPRERCTVRMHTASASGAEAQSWCGSKDWIGAG